MELRPANSMQGFISASLRVPSSDPLPSDDTSAIHLQVPAYMERLPGKSHAYHTLEPPNLASGRTGRVSEREERGGGGVVALNPDNRTNLRDVAFIPQDVLTKGERPSASFSIHQRKHQHDVVLPQQAKHKAVNTCLPPIPVPKTIATEEDVDTIDRGKGLEDPHKYDEIELKDGAAAKSKPAAESSSKEHAYDELEGDQSTTTSKFLMERETVYTAHFLKSNPDSVINSKVGSTEKTDSTNIRRNDQPQTRRTTYSNTPNVFDDPMYDTAFGGAEDGSLPKGPSHGNITTDPPTVHPRTRSLMQTPVARQDYKLTENITAKDFSKPELSTPLESETVPPLPSPNPATRSHDEYECTNLFDDPEYEMGLNLKR